MATTFQPIHCGLKAEDLELGKDYAIVSMDMIHDFMDIDEEEFFDGFDVNDTQTIDQLCGIDSLELIRSKRIYKNHRQILQSEIEKRNVDSYQFSETPYVSNAQFYLPKQPIQLTAAHTFGLGVVQILQGRYKGEFFLYNYMRMNDSDMIEEDEYDENMMLRMYFQYTNPFAYFDTSVADLIEKRWDLASILIVNHKQYMREYFEAVAAYHRAKEMGSVPIDLMRLIRGMKL